MTELTLCMAGAILLLVVACALLWAQIVWLKIDIKELYYKEPCPGDLIAKIGCPICGADITVEHGDDPGEISALATSTPTREKNIRELVEKAQLATGLKPVVEKYRDLIVELGFGYERPEHYNEVFIGKCVALLVELADKLAPFEEKNNARINAAAP